MLLLSRGKRSGNKIEKLMCNGKVGNTSKENANILNDYYNDITQFLSSRKPYTEQKQTELITTMT